MAFYLERTNGSGSGTVETFETDRIRVGRNPDNDLTFDAESARQVSRYHAEIYLDGAQAFVTDLQSRNGTFVEGRRIDQPTPLREGDTIQFAAGGPTVRFSTRSAGSATEHRPPPPAAEAAEPAPVRGRWRRAAVVLGVALALAAVVGGVVGYVWSSWWFALGGFAVAAALESVGLFVWSWWRGRRERMAEPREAASGPPAADTQQELAQRWAEGLDVLRRSDLKQGSEGAIYALPWYLLLGERGSGRTAAVRGARPLPSSPASRRHAGATTTCDWWFFEQCVVLDVTGRYLSQGAESADGAEWRRFLGLLRRTRRREPLNGVVVALTVQDLTRRSVERLQEQAGQVRHRLDQMGRELGIVFPVYVLVTGLDAIPGFTRFFGRLPDGAADQAMGATHGEIDSPDAGATAERTVRTITARLEALRLATLGTTATADDPSHVFLFVEEFKTLERPLRAFATALFRRSPYHETPRFRGIYFSCAAQQRAGTSQLAARMGLEARAPIAEGGSRPFFARHLFTHVLPGERGLVQPTAAWFRRYHGAQLAGILAALAVALALVLVFTLSFVRNSQALSRVAVDGCRPRDVASPPGVRLVQLEDCREAVESLIPGSRWARLSTDFGLRHTHRLEAALRRRYVEAARRDVIEPLEARVDAKLAPGPEAPTYVAALLDRIQLIGRCRTGRCDTLDDWMSPRYSLMLAADQPGVAEPTVKRLARTHAAYLRWQPDVATLDSLRGADADRVTRWIRANGLRPEWILASASARFPAVRMKDFWGVEGTAVVDGAYTARAWNDALAPLVTGLRAIAVDQISAPLNQFEAAYRRDGRRQWQAFLEAFPGGERLAAGRRADRDFAGWMVKPDSPYRRLQDAAVVNVAPLATDPQEDLPPWVRTVARYAALRAQLAKLSPEEQKTRLKPHEREAAVNLAAYGEASEQLRAEMATPERAYRSALRVFEEDKPSARSTHPIQKAYWSVLNLRVALGETDDDLFWRLFTRPIDLSWRALLDQAGVHLQQQWEAIYPELMAPETAPAQRASRAIGFVNDKLAPVLDRQGERYAARTIFGEGIAFKGEFFQFLASARQYQPTAAAKLEPPRQIVSTF